MYQGKQLVLASKSPRRKELLEQIGLDFIVDQSEFEELSEGMAPEELALHNAFGKAQNVARSHRNSLIIGVDTIISFKEHIIGKPKDEDDAKRILRLLSNTTHKVITAIAIMTSSADKAVSAVETTLVTLDSLEEADIEAYIKSNEGHDKAAGYAIQGLGSLFVKKIEGDYFNIVGLPIYRLKKLLKEFGIKRWWV